MYVEYLMLTCLRVFLEGVLIHSVAFPFRERFYIQFNFILKVYSILFCFHQQNSLFRIENLSEMFDRNIESFDQKFFLISFLAETLRD